MRNVTYVGIILKKKSLTLIKIRINLKYLSAYEKLNFQKFTSNGLILFSESIFVLFIDWFTESKENNNQKIRKTSDYIKSCKTQLKRFMFRKFDHIFIFFFCLKAIKNRTPYYFAFIIRLTLREIFLNFQINISEKYILLKLLWNNILIQLSSTKAKEIRKKIP